MTRLLHIDICPRTLHFKRPAGTSRGVLLTRPVWYLRATAHASGDEARTCLPAGAAPLPSPGTGWGECAPLPGLSCDDVPGYEDVLRRACRATEERGEVPLGDGGRRALGKHADRGRVDEKDRVGVTLDERVVGLGSGAGDDDGFRPHRVGESVDDGLARSAASEDDVKG